MIKSQDIEDICKKLKPIIGEKADRLWHMYLAEDTLDRNNIATEIEICAEKYLKQKPLDHGEILLPPPSPENSKGIFCLGNVIYNKKPICPLFLRDEDFVKQVGIFSITGEGKTNLAYLLALQLLESNTPFMIIDWKRSWRNLLSLKDKHPKLKKLQVFTIGRDTLPFLWNVFRPPPGANKELWISTISEALEKSHLSGPGVAYYFQKIYSKLLKGISGDDFYMNFFDGQKELQNIKAVQRELKWKQTAQRIFQAFTMDSVKDVFNTRNPVKLEKLLNSPVIFELDLELPKPLRIFFSEMILRWIHLYRLAQGETDNLQHVLFFEEAHNLFNSSPFYKDVNSIENIYREIRGFGQGIVSITQHPSLLPVELLGNCHTQIFLGLQHSDDIRTARKSLFLDYNEEEYLNMLNVGECIVKIKNRIEPCLVKTPLVPVEKGLVNDKWLKMHFLNSVFSKQFFNGKKGRSIFYSLKKNINDILSGKKISPNRSYKENTLLKTKENTQRYFKSQFKGNTPLSSRDSPRTISKAPQKSTANIRNEMPKNSKKNLPQNRLLVDIFKQPFSSTIERYKRLSMHTKAGNSNRKLLISEKCIQPRKIITGQGWITLYELTGKGKMVLRDLGHELKNTSEGIAHRYWKNRIACFYESQGFDVKIEEYYVNGRPDIIIIKDGKKAAIEIETGKSNFLKNIKQGLEAGFDEIICIATTRFVEDKIKNSLREQKISDSRVKITNVMGF